MMITERKAEFRIEIKITLDILPLLDIRNTVLLIPDRGDILKIGKVLVQIGLFSISPRCHDTQPAYRIERDRSIVFVPGRRLRLTRIINIRNWILIFKIV